MANQSQISAQKIPQVLSYRYSTVTLANTPSTSPSAATPTPMMPSSASFVLPKANSNAGTHFVRLGHLNKKLGPMGVTKWTSCPPGVHSLSVPMQIWTKYGPKMGLERIEMGTLPRPRRPMRLPRVRPGPQISDPSWGSTSTTACARPPRRTHRRGHRC